MAWDLSFLSRSSFWTGVGSVATSLAVVRALWDYRQSRRKAEQTRREDVFNQLDDGWREWLRLVIEHPELDLGDVPLHPTPQFSASQLVQRHAMLHLLISLLEKSYLLYQSKEFEDLDDSAMFRTNRAGWFEYMEFWRNDPRLKDVEWGETLANYTPGFRDHMSRPA